MKRKQTNSADTQKALTVMFEVGRIIRHAMIARETLPLPLSYMETLRFIEKKKNPTMRDVAEYLRIAAPSATAIVEALFAEGYLSRKEDSHDRRMVRLLLSPKGKRVLETTRRLRIKALQGIVGSLTAADQRELVRIFSKIVKK